MRIKQHLQTFLLEEDGPAAVEYAVMLAMIIIFCLGAIRAVSDSTVGVWATNTDALRNVDFIQ